MIDLVREKPREALVKFFPPVAPGEAARMPMGIRLLSQLFLPPEDGKSQGVVVKVMGAGVRRLLGIK